MRIMIVTDQYAPMVGGVPTVTRTLARGLAGRGHAVALLAPSPGLRGRLGTEGWARIYLLGSLPWPWYDGMRLAGLPGRAAHRFLARFAPDVVHVHSPVTLGVMACRAAGRLGLPVVYTNHYLPANVRPSRRPRMPGFDALFYSYVIRFANRCTHVTAPTATALRLLHERGLRAPSRVISNGVDLPGRLPDPADAEIAARYGLRPGRALILTVSRLSAEKRVEVLLDAAARLTTDAQLVIAGTGPDETRLRARAGRLGLAGRVRFLGFVPDADLAGLYRLADVFALASEAELQSLATLEAMAAGLPVVAADACALGELVAHGRNGFLAAPGRGDQIAAYLDILAADPGLRARMGAVSLQTVSSHERGRGLAEWESLYRLLAGAGPAGLAQ